MKNWPSMQSHAYPYRPATPSSDEDDLVIIGEPSALAQASGSASTPAPTAPTARMSLRPTMLSMTQRKEELDRAIRFLQTAAKNLPQTSQAKHQPLAVNRSNDDFRPLDFAKPFCRFLTKNPTVFHVVDKIGTQLSNNGYTKLSERDMWKLEKGGKYYVERNGSSLIAFAVGAAYEPGNGVAMIAGHVDALTAKVKPIPGLPVKEGYVQLGVAPYAGALNSTWWDRDLGIAGRVLVREESGKIVSKLVNLNDPIARIPTLAPHFGAIANGPFNLETQMVPIIGLDNSDLTGNQDAKPETLGDVGTFAATQPARLVRAICGELNIQDYNSLVNWELELFDVQSAKLGGLDKEFLYGGRIDDKICSWAAIQALLGSAPEKPDETHPSSSSSIIKMVGLFDDEEIGSLLRQGAKGNFMPSTVERILDSLAGAKAGANLLAATYANSFLVSSDVSHAFNPNFPGAYLPNHSPRLNVGVAVSADSNGHMTTDAPSTALFQRCADLAKAKLQIFQIRNDVRSGGTVGPMLSAAMGCRAIDAGIVQLSMHSIRATTGSLDPGLGVQVFKGFLDNFEAVDAEFR